MRQYTMIALAALWAASLGPSEDPRPTRRVRLEADTTIGAIRCAATGEQYAELYVESGRLAECPLADPATVDGHALPVDTWIILDADGRLARAWLSRDTRIGEVVCKGTGYKDWITEFHDDGTLAMCFLPDTTIIDGIACRRASIFGELTGGVAVRFHPNGRLASCALARATTIDGVRYRAWRRVRFDAGATADADR